MDIELFKEELEHLINKHSMENYGDIPDFLLAELLTSVVINSGPIIKKILDWHGCDSVCHPIEHGKLHDKINNPWKEWHGV